MFCVLTSWAEFPAISISNMLSGEAIVLLLTRIAQLIDQIFPLAIEFVMMWRLWYREEFKARLAVTMSWEFDKSFQMWQPSGTYTQDTSPDELTKHNISSFIWLC